jgi:hypothetical protein
VNVKLGREALMDWLIATGATCLGVLIGALVGWFVNEATVMNQKVIGVAISILSGAGVLGVFGMISGGNFSVREYWFYPVGLLAGFTTITVVEICYYGYDGDKRRHKKTLNSK